MTELEKVIKGLECCLPMTRKHGIGDCGECPYDRKITLEGGITECCHELMLEAHALLKAQEPRVMTLGELRECVTYWIEDETGHVVPETIMDITGKDIMTIPVVHLTNGYAPIITKTSDGYNSKRFTGWRCWTSRPDEKRRTETPWE